MAPSIPKAGRVTRAVDRVTGRAVKLAEHEIVTGHRIASLGVNVHFLTNPHGRRSADVLIRGQLWELKAPTGAGQHVIAANLAKAQTQAAQAVLDLHRSALTTDAATKQIELWLRNPRNRLAALWVLPKNALDHWIWER